MQKLTLQNVSSNIFFFITNYLGDSRIRRIGIFGSVSRGENGSDSDIDIVTEYDFNGIFDIDDYVKYCTFCNALKENFEEMYKRKVDVVDHGQLFQADNVFSEEVSKDVKWIYVNKQEGNNGIKKNI